MSHGGAEPKGALTHLTHLVVLVLLFVLLYAATRAVPEVHGPAGTIAAAPSAWMMRKTTNASTDHAVAQSPEPATNTASPARKTRLRPKTSASRPKGRRNAAKTTL